MITKRYFILLITALLACCAVIFFIRQHHAGKAYLRAVPVKTAYGWGYDIVAGDHVFIHQDVIPALAGKQGFKTEDDALRVGRRVVEKLSRNELPSISEKDLRELGILKE